MSGHRERQAIEELSSHIFDESGSVCPYLPWAPCITVRFARKVRRSPAAGCRLELLFQAIGKVRVARSATFPAAAR